MFDCLKKHRELIEKRKEIEMYLFDLFSEELFNEMKEKGYIREQTSPFGDFFILNYTEKAQFERVWNEVTLNCRGLIIDDNNFVVARPFPKFFNLGEGEIQFDMDAPVVVTDKMDGSLGILYPTGDDEWAVATRGSFASDQAIHATKVWKKRYEGIVYPPPGVTLLFEIIYPENRIVIDYGPLDDIVLLGAVDNKFGFVMGPKEVGPWIGWTGHMAQTFEYQTMQEAFEAKPRENAEGYVVRSGSKMVKLKQSDYVELHKLISNLSEKSVWQGLRDGKTAQEICEALPDEFHGFVKETAEKLTGQVAELALAVTDAFIATIEKTGVSPSRKDFAFATTMSPYRKYMFLMLDGKDVRDLFWDDIKPKGDNKGVHGL